ncbi:MAG: RidA family protein [Chloroflexota bacterium]|nr:RidA family protein [Chloroflexota bacterium]
MSSRRNISSGGPWEGPAGYSRAVVVGDSCWVSGTTDAGPDGRSRHPGDVAGQARATLEIIGRALHEAGFTLADVVRTRMYITDIGRADELIAVHGEVFGSIRPATTLVEVSALLEPTMLVEIEAEARRG